MRSSFSAFLKTPTGRYYVLALFIYSIVVPVTIYINFHGLAIDEAAYYNISLKYRGLHFKEALNAYWSPLLSWLMIPLISIPFFAFREIMIVNFLCGFVLIYISYKFSRRHALSFPAEIIFLFSMLCLIIFMQLPILWPDFLSATTFITYVFLISSSRLKQSSSFYLLTGASALLCAFAKSFFVFYVFAHLFILLTYAVLNKKNNSSLYRFNLAKTLLVFIAGISIWSGLLSWKYERFMINSSGVYNSNLISPNGYLSHYSETSGLLPPPDEYSVNHWVDPTYYPIGKKAIFENKASLLYQWGIIKYNLKIAFYMFSYFSYLKIFSLLFIFLLFFIQNKTDKKSISIYFFSSLLILAGYTLLFMEERYLIGSQILLYMAVFIAFYSFYKEKLSAHINTPWIFPLLLLLISLSFLKTCHLQYISWRNNHFDFTKTNKVEKELVQLHFLKNKRITNGPFGDAISTLDYVALNTGASVWGNTNKLDPEKDQYLDLKKHGIDYYFYNSPHPFPQFLRNKKPVYISQDNTIRIYAMKPYDP